MVDLGRNMVPAAIGGTSWRIFVRTWTAASGATRSSGGDGVDQIGMSQKSRGVVGTKPCMRPKGRALVERLNLAAAHESSAPARGASQNIDAGAFQQSLPPGSAVLFGGSGGKWLGNSRSQWRHHSACGFEFGLPIAASAQTEVANPGESWWQHMQQESSDKLDSFDSHLLASSFGGIVFERKGDVSMVNNQDAVVGNGDAMCIAAQIPKDIFRAGERRFGVDDPVLFIELVEEVPPDAGLAECGGAACQLELTGLVGLVQSSQELAPKQ